MQKACHVWDAKNVRRSYRRYQSSLVWARAIVNLFETYGPLLSSY